MTPITTPIFVPCPEVMPIKHCDDGWHWQHVHLGKDSPWQCEVCGTYPGEALATYKLIGEEQEHGPFDVLCIPCARDIANAVGAIDRWAAKQKLCAVPDAMVEEAERG